MCQLRNHGTDGATFAQCSGVKASCSAGITLAMRAQRQDHTRDSVMPSNNSTIDNNDIWIETRIIMKQPYHVCLFLHLIVLCSLQLPNCERLKTVQRSVQSFTKRFCTISHEETDAFEHRARCDLPLIKSLPAMSQKKQQSSRESHAA